MGIKEGLMAEYDHEVASTRKLIERVPAEKLAWKPHPKSMTLGGLALHIANLSTWTDVILQKESFDLAEAPPNLPEPDSPAVILTLFQRATIAARALLDRTDPEFLALWTLKREGQEMFTLPRVAAFRTFVLNHIIHHRGQLTVYLRLNDIPVPAIYGPSADEGN
jgi:uncharacterized damage-inducible protein DinB